MTLRSLLPHYCLYFTGLLHFRLFELRGVVVLEKMTEYRDALKDPEVDETRKLEILDELLSKEPATEIIQSSKIGKVIKKLAQSPTESEFSQVKAGSAYLNSEGGSIRTSDLLLLIG